MSEIRVYPSPHFLKEMPLERRKRWAEALRTTKLRQTQCTLFELDIDFTIMCSCCLGIDWISERGLHEVERIVSKDYEGKYSEVPPLSLYPRNDSDPFIGLIKYGPDRFVRASDCNDTLGLSFIQIASLVNPEHKDSKKYVIGVCENMRIEDITKSEEEILYR